MVPQSEHDERRLSRTVISGRGWGPISSDGSTLYGGGGNQLSNEVNGLTLSPDDQHLGNAHRRRSDAPDHRLRAARDPDCPERQLVERQPVRVRRRREMDADIVLLEGIGQPPK